MLLIAAATAGELACLQEQFAGRSDVCFLVTGVGLVETSHALTLFLEQQGGAIRAVLNVGVGGAFVLGGLKVLDLCLADSEVIGDMAICFADRLEPLGSSELVVRQFFPCPGRLRADFQRWSLTTGREIHAGPFVSVNCVSATTARGNLLAATYEAVCENMEGAAVARVCQTYNLDWLELRAMSNMVEDRDPTKWRLAEAIDRCTAITAQFLTHYLH